MLARSNASRRVASATRTLGPSRSFVAFSRLLNVPVYQLSLLTMSSSIDMSLSDIIKTNKSSFKKSASTAGIKKRGSFKGRRSSTGAASKTTPRRQSGGARRSSQGFSRQDKTVTPNDKRTVRVNISNLAASVHTGDLQELFGEFHLRSAIVNFNETGAPLGTGDVTLSKSNADRLMQKFAGVSLDGKLLKFAMIDSNNIAARTSFPAQKIEKVQKRRSSGGFKPKKDDPKKKKSGAGKAGAKKMKKNREEKPTKTAEELDAELDAYMARAE